jgi:hypothetical protein
MRFIIKENQEEQETIVPLEFESTDDGVFVVTTINDRTTYICKFTNEGDLELCQDVEVEGIQVDTQGCIECYGEDH